MKSKKIFYSFFTLIFAMSISLIAMQSNKVAEVTTVSSTVNSNEVMKTDVKGAKTNLNILRQWQSMNYHFENFYFEIGNS